MNGQNLSHCAAEGREQLLLRVKAMVLSFLKGTATGVYLFGSFAKGEERQSSDIDIAIDHGGQVTPDMFAALRDLLHESPIPYTVDILDLLQAGEIFAAKVRKEGIPWSE